MSAATELSQPDFVFSARESHSAAKWARRSKTVPALFIAFFLVWLLLPVLFAFSFIHDLIRDREFSTTRLTLFGAWWLTMEMLGVVTAFILWLIFLPSTKSTSTKSNRWHNRLQCLWAKSLTAGAKRTIGLRWSAEGISCLRPKGPLIILARHGSQGDALLTAALLSNEGRRLRFVLKKQLLNDPCLDIVGHRIPNYFVNRDSLDNQEELANISVLASGLEDDEALVIFPEGTRFSPSKLAKAIDTLTEKTPGRAESARQLRSVLPIRTAGTLATLSASDADIVFCNHVGISDIASIRELRDAIPLKKELRFKLTRVPRSDLSSKWSEEELVRWLDTQWALVDDWVTAHEGPKSP
jgi:1-acyl-sn-glycerol-3-phosphate acyltransferase